MESAEASKPLVEFPIDLRNQDLRYTNPRERAKRAQEARFWDYDGFEKGAISGASAYPLLSVCCADDLESTRAGSPCCRELLDAMMVNIRIMYVLFMLDRTHGLEAAIFVVLDKTKAELKRLLQHPELFPDRTQEWFPQVMKLELQKVLDHLALQDAADKTENAEYQENLERQRKKILPEYDVTRTVWQQFLHGQAPGSGLSRPLPYSQGCSQLLTWSAFRLLGATLADHLINKRSLIQVGSSLQLIFYHVK